jgi:hypothetical protein
VPYELPIFPFMRCTGKIKSNPAELQVSKTCLHCYVSFQIKATEDTEETAQRGGCVLALKCFISYFYF